nr:hypothetical protein [Carnobacterium maltaromaticum]
MSELNCNKFDSIMPLINSVIDSLPFERIVVNDDKSKTRLIISEMTLKELCNKARMKMNDLNVEAWEQIRESQFEKILENVLINNQVAIIDLNVEEQDFKLKKI